MNIFPFTPYITNELSVKLLCMVIKTCCILLSILLFISCSDEKILPEQQYTLEKVKKRGVLLCGVHKTKLQGFAYKDSDNYWSGMDIDICRAVAAAVLGDAQKVKYIPISDYGRFHALQLGKVDILSRNLTWTLSRDTLFNIDFTAVTYYDGQGFMVPKKSNIKQLRDLTDKTICVTSHSSTEINMEAYFRTKKINHNTLVLPDAQQVVDAYNNGKCDAYTSDRAMLAIRRTTLTAPDQHIILPQIISKEPISPAVIQGDSQWRDIVRWSIFAMLNAEEHSITSVNVEKSKNKSQHNPAVMRLLGYTDNIGNTLGLQQDWAYQIIKQVGNYGEIYQRNLGTSSKLDIPRGLNKLWTQGGLMYAPPML
jgi:general L-amino acid transport system substrate-binding protein